MKILAVSSAHLVHLARSIEHLNLLLGPQESLHFLVFGPHRLVALQPFLGGEAFLVASELLSIHIWPASTRGVKFLQVPVLIPRDELLLQHVGLHLSLTQLALDVLQHTELLPVLLLELFHLAEQLQLLFVNDLLGFVFEGVGLVQLVVPVADLSFFLFAVDLGLELVNLTLGDVEHVGDLFDAELARFARVPLFNDPLLDHVAFFCALVLNEGRLLINELTLCLLDLLW